MPLPILPVMQDTNDKDSAVMLDIYDHMSMIRMQPHGWSELDPFARHIGVFAKLSKTAVSPLW